MARIIASGLPLIRVHVLAGLYQRTVRGAMLCTLCSEKIYIKVSTAAEIQFENGQPNESIQHGATSARPCGGVVHGGPTHGPPEAQAAASHRETLRRCTPALAARESARVSGQRHTGHLREDGAKSRRLREGSVQLGTAERPYGDSIQCGERGEGGDGEEDAKVLVLRVH
uniref:Putative secreted protein n=1 Tax=Anopheles darlingi TaxID=43151 RepID=A0A2M4DAJ5_ANODA